MGRMTLIEMTQDILNDLSDDEVNSINDTAKSLQIANIIRSTYFSIIDGKYFPHLYKVFQLEGLANPNKPNYMKIPSSIANIDWVKYNKRTSVDIKEKFEKITYKTPSEFIDIVDARDSSASNIQLVQDFNGVILNIFTDRAPTYYTSFDDEYLIFDSFDIGVDSTMHASKTSSYGRGEIDFVMSDTFIPDLPTQMFSYLLNEAKSTAFSISKQALNPKIENNAKTQRYRMSQQAWKNKDTKGITYPNYGRK